MEYKFGYVGIIGRPNAGKSTLVNHFVGEKVSIISPKPQTTRNNILGILNSEFEQIVFVDTPGIHLAKNGLDKFMMKNIRSAQDNVNCIVYVMDGLKPFSSNEMAYINDLCEKEIPIIVAVNKIDKTKFEKLYPELAKLNDLKKILDIVPISALNGENSDVLLEKIRNTLTVVGGKDEFDLPLDEYTDKSTLFML
ncbi:MAG: GTPase Era, partial [Clostridia bacterium]